MRRNCVSAMVGRMDTIVPADALRREADAQVAAALAEMVARRLIGAWTKV